MSESCPICTKTFQTKAELEQHWFEVHNLDPKSTWPLSEKRMNCDTCAKVRGSTSSYEAADVLARAYAMLVKEDNTKEVESRIFTKEFLTSNNDKETKKAEP